MRLAAAAALAAPLLIAAPAAHAFAVAGADAATSLELTSALPAGVTISFEGEVFDEGALFFTPDDDAVAESDIVTGTGGFLLDASAFAIAFPTPGGAFAFSLIDGFIDVENTTNQPVVLDFEADLFGAVFAEIDGPEVSIAGASAFFSSDGFDEDYEIDFGAFVAGVGADDDMSAFFETLSLSLTLAPFASAEIVILNDAEADAATGLVPLPAAAPFLLFGVAALGVAARKRRAA